MGGIFGGGAPDIPKQNLSVDINKILNQYRQQIVPAFHKWQETEPVLQQLNQFTTGTQIPRLTQLLNNFPDVNQTIAPLQGLLNNQPNINATLGPLQQIMKNLPSAGSLAGPLQNTLANMPSAGQFAAPIGGVSQSLQQTMRGLAPVSQLTDPLRARIASLTNVAPTLQQTFGQQLAPILTSGGALTRDQQQAAQQEALANAALQGNAFGNQATMADILNQQKYKDARLAGAIQNATGLQGIQAQDVAARTALPQAIQQLTGADIANRLGLGQGITQAQQAQQGVYGQDLASRLAGAQGIQNIFGQDITQRLGLTQGMDALRNADINRRLGLTTGIQGIRGTDLAQQLGLMQGISGAITGPLQTSESTFNALMNPLMGFAGNVFDANQNAAAAQNIAGANKSAGTTSGILNAAGSILGGAISDERLKANVRPTGATTPEGIPIKTFTYRGEPKRRYVGVIAQDVEKKLPGAVITLPVTGHKLVDRSKIAAPFHEITTQRRKQ